MTKKEQRLMDCFTELFNILDINYIHFNTRFKVNTKKKRDDLIKLEEKYPELGITGKNLDTVTVVSLMATITDFLCGKRFGVVLCKRDWDEIEAVKIQSSDLLKY